MTQLPVEILQPFAGVRSDLSQIIARQKDPRRNLRRAQAMVRPPALAPSGQNPPPVDPGENLKFLLAIQKHPVLAAAGQTRRRLQLPRPPRETVEPPAGLAQFLAWAVAMQQLDDRGA